MREKDDTLNIITQIWLFPHDESIDTMISDTPPARGALGVAVAAPAALKAAEGATSALRAAWRNIVVLILVSVAAAALLCYYDQNEIKGETMVPLVQVVERCVANLPSTTSPSSSFSDLAPRRDYSTESVKRLQFD